MKKVLLFFLVLIPFVVKAEQINLYDVFKQEAENNGLAKEYTGEHQDSFIKEATSKIYHWYAVTIDDKNNVLEKNNVIFGGFCWQMVRTTDTGGVKLMYNGIPNEGKCNNSGVKQTIGSSFYNSNSNNLYLPSSGYMYNDDYQYSTGGGVNSLVDRIYANDVTYSDGMYTLVNTRNGIDNGYHYSCGGSLITCESVRYYIDISEHLILTEGKKIEDVVNYSLYDENVNKYDSDIKTFIDNWYENNLISYGDYIEDTIYCNDRRPTNIYGWDKDGILSIHFDYYNIGSTNNLKCGNELDMFSVSNPKAKLKYPIALMTAPEMSLSYSQSLWGIDETYWLISPRERRFNAVVLFDGRIENAAGFLPTLNADVRPAITLRSDVVFNSGDGSKNNPYTNASFFFYSITVVNDNSKGNIDFFINDLSNVESGTTVRFRVSPNSGFNLDEYELVTSDGQVLGVTKTNEDNVYEFVMPERNVTLTLQYKQLQSAKPDVNQENPKTEAGSKIILLCAISLVMSIALIVGRRFNYQ